MMLLIFLIVGVLVSAVDLYLFKKISLRTKIINSLFYLVGVNTLSLFIMRFILNKEHVLSQSNYQTVASRIMCKWKKPFCRLS